MNSTKEIGLTVKKTESFGEWYSQVVAKGGLADYAYVKGFLILRPYGYSIWAFIKDILDNRFKETGHQNGFLPTLIPESLLRKEEEHFAGFNPEVFWVTKAGNNELSERLALRPTSETIAYSVFSKWIGSYRDLPLKINYWNTALRAEIKATKPFIRNSEFLWQEGHTVHETNEEAEKEVMAILEMYREVMEQYLAIPVLEGFKSQKEKFVGAVFTTALEALMGDGRALQMATSHYLGQNFSKPFQIKYLGKDNREHFAWQTSWGMSWRVVGALVMVHGDDKGLIIPPKVAPIQVVVVPIYRAAESEIVKAYAYGISIELQKFGIRVQVDDRDEYTSGWKFNEWEIKGVPLRLNIGPRDLQNEGVEIVRRDTGEKIAVKRRNFTAYIVTLLDSIQENLFRRALDYLSKNTLTIDDYNLFKTRLEQKGGLIYAGWCGKAECESRIKEETGADIRIIPFQTEHGVKPTCCIYCNTTATEQAVFARAY